MRISCDVKVSSQLLPTQALSGPGKGKKASLAIGHKPGGSKADVGLLLCTGQNRTGTYYKVHDNVQIFSKFSHEGKATLRFKQPPHDLGIQKADPIQLKSFLTVLSQNQVKKQSETPKSSQLGQPASQKTKCSLPLLIPASKKQVESIRRKLVITATKNYPPEFSVHLQILQISGCKLSRVPTAVLRLVNLKELDLSDNQIEEIPTELGKIPLLLLIMKGNRIKEVNPNALTGKWKTSLHSLDLSNNLLEVLPPQLCELRALTSLRVASNELVKLPRNLGFICNLKELVIDHNKINILPATIISRKLDKLDISDNPFMPPHDANPSCNLKVQTLLEAAARVIMKNRIAYQEDDLPAVLHNYLKMAAMCPCGGVSFESQIVVIKNISMQNMVHTLTHNHDSNMFPVQMFLCSIKCAARYYSANFYKNL